MRGGSDRSSGDRRGAHGARGGGVSQSRCRGVWGRSVGGASGVGRPVGLLGWTVGFRRWTIGQSL
jgi:hypothetical protein